MCSWALTPAKVCATLNELVSSQSEFWFDYIDNGSFIVGALLE